MYVNVTIEGRVVAALLDDTSSNVIVPCVGCDDCASKSPSALLTPRTPGAPYQQCTRPGVCIAGTFTVAEVTYQSRVVTNHVVCATHFPINADAVIGTHNLKRSFCFNDDKPMKFDLVVDPPCDVEWKRLRPEKLPSLAFKTQVEGSTQLVFFSVRNSNTFVPYTAKIACEDFIEFEDLDTRVPCDHLVVDNVFILGTAALHGKRVFFDDGYIGFTHDPECSATNIATTLPLPSPLPSASASASSPTSLPSRGARLPFTRATPTLRLGGPTQDYTAVYAFLLVFFIAFAYEVWQQTRSRA